MFEYKDEERYDEDDCLVEWIPEVQEEIDARYAAVEAAKAELLVKYPFKTRSRKFNGNQYRDAIRNMRAQNAMNILNFYREYCQITRDTWQNFTLLPEITAPDFDANDLESMKSAVENYGNQLSELDTYIYHAVTFDWHLYADKVAEAEREAKFGPKGFY